MLLLIRNNGKHLPYEKLVFSPFFFFLLLISPKRAFSASDPKGLFLHRAPFYAPQDSLSAGTSLSQTLGKGGAEKGGGLPRSPLQRCHGVSKQCDHPQAAGGVRILKLPGLVLVS